ncbi:MAG: NAD(P)-dependent oxidoreductase [Burkholderiales bacterium]
MSAASSIGFIGIGAMGAPMALRLLQAGHRVVVPARSKQAARLIDAGAVGAADAEAIASEADTVLVCLPTPDVVEAVAEEIARGRSVRRYVDLSTTGPTVAVRVAQRLGERGIQCLDAPVSGGVQGAVAGTLAIMAAGARETFEALAPLLSAMGQNVFHVGPDVGQGQAVKLANNMMSASAMMAAAEGLALCVRAGVDPALALQAINAGSGRSVATERAFPAAVLSGTYQVGFRLALMHKDVRLCLQEARALNVPMWQAATLGQMYDFAMSQGMGEGDVTTMVKMVAQWAHVDFAARAAAPGA